MKFFLIAFALVSFGFTPAQPKPSVPSTLPPSVVSPPKPSLPSPTPQTTPAPKVKSLVVLGAVGPSVVASTVQTSLDLLNQVYANGCMEKKLTMWSIPYLTTANGVKMASKQAAFARYIQGAPYKVDIRWYQENSTVMGYTYNWRLNDNGTTDQSQSETRIWTNRTDVTGPKTYAAHLAHELSHQIRAGGFVHWTQFQGTVPYEFGDIAYACLSELPEPRAMMTLKSVPTHENWLELKAKHYRH